MNTLKKIAFAGLFFSLTLSTLVAQDTTTFEMGIPSDKDPQFQKIPVKARLTKRMYKQTSGKKSLKPYAPTPGSQGNYGTCTAWAAAYTARTILAAQYYGWTRQSQIDSNVFAYGFLYRLTDPGTLCQGALVSKTIKNLKTYGVPLLSDFPEHCVQESISSSIYKKAEKYKLSNYATLWNSTHKATISDKIRLLKKSLKEAHPVVIAMYTPQSFCYPNNDYLWTPLTTDQAGVNQKHQHACHAMCIIGYDDTKYGGAFEFQNSWGTTWGNQGRIWVRYADAAEFIYQAIELFKDEETDKSKATPLAGGLRLQEQNGLEMQASYNESRGVFELDRAYRSGTRFRLYLRNNQPAYVYAIGTDLSHEIYQLFPHKDGISAALNYRQNEVAIPSETAHIRMDNKAGKDLLCLLYSKRPLKLSVIKEQLAKMPNELELPAKIKRLMGKFLVPQEKIQYIDKDGSIYFNSMDTPDKIAPLYVEIIHTD